jgi:glucose/arabinose dehydrogenase
MILSNIRNILGLCFAALLIGGIHLRHAYSDDKAAPEAGGAIPRITLSKIAGGFTDPTHIANAGDNSGRLFNGEQKGIVKIIRNGSVQPTPFLDISSRVKSGGEQGLLAVVFPPGYGAGKHHFYVNYTSRRGNGDTVIARFRVSRNPDQADAASEQLLLTFDQPFANHNGGQMAFGPDGFLYIGTGDGGSAGDPFGNGQSTKSLLGKVLRIDAESGSTTYKIPSDNPFAGKSGPRPEIWSYGLRNPWRFSFDRKTGDLYIADVGQYKYEEVHVQPRSSRGGENYGWNIMEGLHCFKSDSCNQKGLTMPVIEYDHSKGDCSITGGFVYRGREFPVLQGVYLYGDYCTGRIWGARKVRDAWESKLLLESKLNISTFGEDQEGNLYVADHDGGGIYKIVVP